MDATTDARELIDRARRGDVAALGCLLEARRSALRAITERALGERVATRVDASDVVQRTFLEAHRGFSLFAGRDEPELGAWLRKVLDNQIAAAIRDNTKLKKRDIRRERSLDAVTQNDSQSPRELACGHSSPSTRAIRGEEAGRLTAALATLPEDQREAVRLRHLEGWPLERISEQMGRSPQATAGLIKRGMQALRRTMRDSE